MKFINKKVIAASLIVLSIIITGCSNNSTLSSDLPQNEVVIKDEVIIEDDVASKRISGEESKNNLLKIKEDLFSGEELNNFIGRIVNIDPYVPEDENYPPTTIYTVEMTNIFSTETNESIELNEIEILIDIQNFPDKELDYEIGDELFYNKQSQFDSGWYIHEDQVLYISKYN